jgi:outer membrane protein OmpA-like peptidoglycan-associated protein
VISDSGNIQARFNLGVAYQMQERYGEAIVEFQKALRIEDLPRIHVMLGAVYIMQERYNDAMEELKNVVFFGFEKTRVSPAGVQAIKQFAKVVKVGALQAPLRVEGHTDDRGTQKTNRQIAKDRAIAVAMELIAMNSVEPDFIFIRGVGETDPIAPNSSVAGRRLNRRVEMSIHKQEELH